MIVVTVVVCARSFSVCYYFTNTKYLLSLALLWSYAVCVPGDDWWQSKDLKSAGGRAGVVGGIQVVLSSGDGKLN